MGGTIVIVTRAARPEGGRRNEVVVGRVEQRAQLLGVLDDVIADGSRFVIMGGDAGAGKTTVIETFLNDLNGRMSDRKAQVITGQCVPLGGDGLPYAPIVGALHDLVGRYGPDQIRPSARCCPTWWPRRGRQTPCDSSCSRPSPCCGSAPANTAHWW